MLLADVRIGAFWKDSFVRLHTRPKNETNNVRLTTKHYLGNYYFRFPVIRYPKSEIILFFLQNKCRELFDPN